MARKLAYSVLARETELNDKKRPELGSHTVREEFFEAGSELPEWAQKVVGEHVYAADESASEAPAEDVAPSEPEAPAESPAEDA
jgi:hypothetical protein